MWGGDWNHALSGKEHARSRTGRDSILAWVESLDLVVPTSTLPHRIDGLLSIDHIAVPTRLTIVGAEHIGAARAGERLSDHDAYLVTIRLS